MKKHLVIDMIIDFFNRDLGYEGNDVEYKAKVLLKILETKGCMIPIKSVFTDGVHKFVHEWDS